MNDQDAVKILFQLVKAQVDPSSTLADVEATLQTVAAQAGIDQQVVEAVLQRFHAEHQPPPQTVAPRLLVDWGELPRVGQSVRPEFSLICPGYTSRPELRIVVDRDLDHDPNDPLRRPEAEEPGLWIFHVPFRMTTNGLDCRAGYYLIDVAVFFRHGPGEMPHFFRCRIRLHVADTSSSGVSVLEIDGDGQSIVNLQGYDLRQFSKVVLKGGQDSVINLQNLLGDTSVEQSGADQKEHTLTTFEYRLKADTERQSRAPTVRTTAQPRAYLDAAGFFFDDGRRTLVMTRPRMTFGRSRENDVVVRFLPRSDENDEYSRNISRTHFLAELTSEGVEVRDESRSGVEVDCAIVHEPLVVPATHVGDPISIELGVTGTVSKPFRFEMLLFAPERNIEREDLEFWHELYCEQVGGCVSRLARNAIELRIDAIRFDRVENLAGEEAYVMLLREALIGNSRHRAAIVLRYPGPPIQARLLHLDRSFWLEALPGCGQVWVDGTMVAPQMIVPLAPGMRVGFGNDEATFDRPAQLYLD